MPPVKDRRLEPSFRVSRQIATLFTAWLGCLVEDKGRFNVLLFRWLKPIVGKGVKTPFLSRSTDHHALKCVAIRPKGQAP